MAKILAGGARYHRSYRSYVLANIVVADLVYFAVGQRLYRGPRSVPVTLDHLANLRVVIIADTIFKILSFKMVSNSILVIESGLK